MTKINQNEKISEVKTENKETQTSANSSLVVSKPSDTKVEVKEPNTTRNLQPNANDDEAVAKAVRAERKRQDKRSNTKIGILYVLLTIILEATIAGTVIGVLGLTTYGEVITTGTLNGDIALTATSLAALFNSLLFMLIALIEYLKKRTPIARKEAIKALKEAQQQAREEKQEAKVENKEETKAQPIPVLVPPIPAGAKADGRDKKWMSHTKFSKEN